MTDHTPHHPGEPTPVRRIRDLLILDERLVIATDSLGGIGPKPADTYYADAATVAHFAFRVPLLEVICSGARPVAAVDNLCVEFEPTGRTMLQEIRRLAAAAGIDPDAVTGSTEENVATRATGIGVTVLGRIPPDGLLSGGSRAGDVVLCAGRPLSAPHDEVTIGHPSQVTVAAVAAAVGSGVVHDALPVGSRGLAWELDQLAASAGLEVSLLDTGDLPLTRSGGPASCVLFSCASAAAADLVAMLGPDTPVRAIARLLRPGR